MVIYSFYHINMQKNNINFRFIFIKLYKNEEENEQRIMNATNQKSVLCPERILGV